jgi:hypothetical protein
MTSFNTKYKKFRFCFGNGFAGGSSQSDKTGINGTFSIHRRYADW